MKWRRFLSVADPEQYKFVNYAVRSQRFRLVNKEGLFDFKENHTDTTNVEGKYPEVAAKMKKAYEKWWDDMRSYMINENESLEREKPFYVEYEKQKETEGIPDWTVPQL